MEAAQDAIARHTSRKGHFTKISEVIRPAITSETIKPHRHEIVTEAVDREVHQHHYHTTVQPLSHVETLPTVHTHNLVAIKKTSHEHDDVEENNRRLAEFASLFRNLSVTHPTTHTSEKKAAVVGEHVHHHVHEVVQPIIYKETIQREVVHTTLPFRHVVRETPKFHGMSSMPVKMYDEFISLSAGREPGAVRHSEHEGVPRDYDSKFATTFEKLGLVSTPAAASSSVAQTPLDINTTAANAHHTPTTPTRKPVRSHRKSADRDVSSPVSRGSFSSDSSASSEVPTTPTSPQYRNNMLPKNNVMNTMSLDNSVASPTHTTTTTTPTTKVNTTSNTTTQVNRFPSKNAGTNEPVRIRNSNDGGDLSPRYSSDEAGNRRSLVDRLTGRRAAAN